MTNMNRSNVEDELRNPQVRQRFRNKLEEEFIVSNNDPDKDIEQKWKIFKEKLIKVSKEVCGYSKTRDEIPPQDKTITREDDIISKDELSEEVGGIKLGKAHGSDEIASERNGKNAEEALLNITNLAWSIAQLTP
ncbi:hypothetical protein ILUMI_17058 [Ignelater luminosus]|uniref:Uncharacterized protein n=1 Tax=Ignelater luminosus TaxID=2038154 RepID=A0A8K0CKS7_IGNLU|nr:hypothetical protein ILUMI_17058 [Ignelater luminosus]